MKTALLFLLIIAASPVALLIDLAQWRRKNLQRKEHYKLFGITPPDEARRPPRRHWRISRSKTSTR